MSEIRRNIKRKLTQKTHGDSTASPMVSSVEIFEAAARNFDRKLSGKFKMLSAFQHGISDLRTKGASYQTITQMLRQAGVKVSYDTVARFCRMIGNKQQHRQKNCRKSVITSEGKVDATLTQPLRKPDATIDAANEATPKPPLKSRGPRIADPKNL